MTGQQLSASFKWKAVPVNLNQRRRLNLNPNNANFLLAVFTISKQQAKSAKRINSAIKPLIETF